MIRRNHLIRGTYPKTCSKCHHRIWGGGIYGKYRHYKMNCEDGWKGQIYPATDDGPCFCGCKIATPYEIILDKEEKKQRCAFIEELGEYDLSMMLAESQKQEYKKAGIKMIYPNSKLFDKIANKFFELKKINEDCNESIEMKVKSSSHLIDHSYFVKFKGDKDYFYITEPYNFDLEDAKNLIRFCEKHRFNFTIGSPIHSTHYPNRTIAINIFKTKRKQLCTQTTSRRRL